MAQLPSYAPEVNRGEAAWSRLKRSLANLAKCGIDHPAALVKARLTRIQHRTDLPAGFSSSRPASTSPRPPAGKPP